MAEMTRIEVLGPDGHLIGLFFANLPLADCVGKQPADFRDAPGEWVPAGGTNLRQHDWYNGPINLGEMRKLC